MAGDAEKRQFRREDLEVQVDLESEHNFYTGFTENVSTGGLFIATRDLLPIGSRFRIRFSLPTAEEPIEAECEVRWQRLEQLDNADVTPGLGVRFLDLDEKAQDAVNAFIRKRETLFYDDE